MSVTPFTPAGITLDTSAPVAAFENGMTVASDAALKAIATATVSGVGGLPVGSWVRVANNANGNPTGGYNIWTLVAGTHADSPTTGFSEPTDYNASTNQKYWQQLNFPY